MHDLARRLRSFFSELKRRKIFRAAVIYGSVTFVVLQVAAIIFPALHLPDWTLTFLVVVAVLGFPLVLVLEWVFEVTSEGVQREPASAPEARETGRASDAHLQAGASAAGGRLGRRPLLLVPGAAVLLIGAYLLLPRETIEEAPNRSIAVLPFQILGSDPAEEALADGVAEDIHMSLSHIGGIRVTSLRTSLRYRGIDKPLRAIGEELDVAVVLDGSVRQMGDVLRVSLQLIDVRTDHTLWAAGYDQPREGFFARAGEVARNVAAALQVRLTREESERIALPPTENPAAYELLRMARQLWNDLNQGTLEETAELYRMATEVDPAFALAHAELAFVYVWLWRLGDGAAEDRAWESARRGLALDSTLAFGHFVRGNLFLTRGRLGEARRAFRQSIAYDPNAFWPMMDLSIAEFRLGRFDESLYWARRGLERAPDEANSYHHVAVPLLGLGTDEITEALLRSALDKETFIGPFGPFGPKPYPRIPINLARLEVLRGNDAQARAWIRSTLESRPDNQEVLRQYGEILVLTRSDDADEVIETLYQRGLASAARYALVLGRRGQSERADSVVRQALETEIRRFEEGHENPEIPRTVAGLHALSGDPEAALDWLERAYDMGYRQPRLLEREPEFDSLRRHPRFHRLLERMHGGIRPDERAGGPRGADGRRVASPVCSLGGGTRADRGSIAPYRESPRPCGMYTPPTLLPLAPRRRNRLCVTAVMATSTTRAGGER